MIDGAMVVFSGNMVAKYSVPGGARTGPVPIASSDGGIVTSWPSAWNTGGQAALAHPNGSIYLFRGAMYARIDNPGSPGVISTPADIWGNFAGAWIADWNSDATGAQCALDQGNGNAYFFNGTKYARYNYADASVTAPTDIWGNYAGAWIQAWNNTDGVDACVNLGDGYNYFFRGSQVARYRISDNTIASPQPITDHFPQWLAPSEW